MKNLKDILLVAFWLFVMYQSGQELEAIGDLPGFGSSHISLLFTGLLCGGIGYLVGAAREKTREKPHW